MQPHRWTKAQRSLDFPCPVCQNGALRPIKASYSEVETERSSHEDDDGSYAPWNAEWRFCTLLKCTNAICRGVASITGLKYIEPEPTGAGETYDATYYQPDSISPGPLPFRLIPAYPDAIQKEVRKAATLFWVDPGAAANRIRHAVDEMLTERGIARYAKPDSKSPIPLHARIDTFKALDGGKFAEVGMVLEAIKWLGNSGSHDGDLTAANVMDGFDFLGHALEETYVQSKAKLLARAAQVNAAHAPPKKE